jgi:NADPH:quinone reductase-like Zn-dependent oxidoreductase
MQDRKNSDASKLGKRLRVYAKAESVEALHDRLHLEDVHMPLIAEGQVLIEVHASGVNPSDVKAVLGAMPHAVWPRTPGRDYAGTVIGGAAHLLGREVWGSGGEAGIRLDGAHSKYLVLAETDLSDKPINLTVEEAGAVGVPFVTAYEGLREAGPVKSGDIVLILGANGKVGQAATQLAAAAGAQVFIVARSSGMYRGFASAPVTMLNSDGDWAAELRAATHGHGADIVFNTVGSPYFEMACRAMAVLGRQIFISTIERSVPFDIFAFYRGRHRFIGIDTLALNGRDAATILNDLRPQFEKGALRPFPVLDANIYPLDRAADAYKAVLLGAPERIVLTQPR